MAMTSKQRAMNKAAQKVRDEAYRTRVMAHTKALEDISRNPKIFALRGKKDAAKQILNAERRRVKETTDLLMRQIADLEKQIRSLQSDPKIADLEEKFSQAVQAHRRAVVQKKDCVNADFQDLKPDNAVFPLASNWKIPPDVQRAMDDARAEVERTWVPKD